VGNLKGAAGLEMPSSAERSCFPEACHRSNRLRLGATLMAHLSLCGPRLKETRVKHFVGSTRRAPLLFIGAGGIAVKPFLAALDAL